MKLEYQKVDLSKRIDEEQLDKLAKNLKEFLNVYWHNIYVKDDPESMEALAKIDEIRYLLACKHYDELFDDPRIILTKSEMDKIT